LRTTLVLFTRLYKDPRSTKHKIQVAEFTEILFLCHIQICAVRSFFFRKAYKFRVVFREKLAT